MTESATFAAPPPQIRTIADLITSTLHVKAGDAISSLARLFEAHPEIDGIGVVGEAEHVRYISRARFFVNLGKRFGYALFENRPVSLLAEEGSTVEADMDPVEVISVATQREPARIYDDILVVEGARFLGLVSVRSLLVHHKSLLSKGMTERAELEEQNQKLREQYRAQGDALADLALELRGPVDAVMALARQLQRDAEVSARHASTIEALLARAQAAVATVNELNDHARLEDATADVRLEAVELPALLDEAVAEARLLAAGRAVEISARFDGTSRPFRADRVVLRRLLSHLIGGPARHVSIGAVTLVAAVRGEWLSLVAESADTPDGRVLERDWSRIESRRLSLISGLAALLRGSGEAEGTSQGARVLVRLPFVQLQG